jgi:RHS repeat-associated protein
VWLVRNVERSVFRLAQVRRRAPAFHIEIEYGKQRPRLESFAADITNYNRSCKIRKSSILLSPPRQRGGVYYYYLKDHLGNNRLVINSSGAVIEKSHYYPSGMRFSPESTSNSAALPYRYNGKELEAMNGLNQMDYGARRRFSWAPIWTGPDELREKYYSISPYAYCLNNPMKFIDPDGKVVGIPKAHRKEVLEYINSRSAGVFSINRKGELFLKSKDGSNENSTYYRDKLVAAIKDPDVIMISQSSTFIDKDSKTENVDKERGGGVTVMKNITTTDNKGKQTKTKEADIILSGNTNKNMIDSDGKSLLYEPADILMHEFLGHAAPFTVGTDTGNAVDNENKAREQLPTKLNQKRAKESDHKE